MRKSFVVFVILAILSFLATILSKIFVRELSECQPGEICAAVARFTRISYDFIFVRESAIEAYIFIASMVFYFPIFLGIYFVYQNFFKKVGKNQVREKFLLVLLLLAIAVSSSALTIFVQPLSPISPCNWNVEPDCIYPLVSEGGFPARFYYPPFGKYGLIDYFGFLADTIFFLFLYLFLYLIYKITQKKKKK